MGVGSFLFPEGEASDTPEVSMMRWRRRALELFAILLASIHFPMVLVAILRGDISLESRAGVLIGWIIVVVTAVFRSIPHQIKVWMLVAATWAYAFGMLSRGGVMLGFRVVMVTTPVAIMLLGGVATGIVFASLNIVIAGAALWGTSRGLIPLPVNPTQPGEWIFQLLPNIGTIIPQVALLAWFTYFINRYIRRHHAVSQSLKVEAAEKERLEVEVQQASELEQRRIGRELHDGVCQELTGLLLLTKRLKKVSCEETGAGVNEMMLEQLAEGLGRSIGEIHGLSRRLSPGQISPLELPGALQDLVKRCQERADVVFTFKCKDDGGCDVKYDAINVYRIAQEAISNAIRHANAQNIEVHLTLSCDGLRLSIEDDGKGIPDSAELGVGLGLKTMRWRASREGGWLSVGRTGRGGTRVGLEIPGPRGSLADGHREGSDDE